MTGQTDYQADIFRSAMSVRYFCRGSAYELEFHRWNLFRNNLNNNLKFIEIRNSICLYSSLHYAPRRTVRPSLATPLHITDGLLVIGIQPIGRGNFRTAAMLLSYILPNISFTIRSYSKNLRSLSSS